MGSPSQKQVNEALIGCAVVALLLVIIVGCVIYAAVDVIGGLLT